MKKLLTLLLLSTSLPTFADSHLDFTLSDFCYQQPDVQNRGGVYYFANEEVGITANSICVYKDSYGQYQSKGRLKNGKYDGKVNYWYEDGQIKTERIYKDGKLVSQTDYLYYENGQEFAELNYKDGKKDGKWTFWYKNGRKDEESYYKDGDLVNETIFKYNYLTGQITGQSYKDGKKDGKWTKWYKDGEKKYEKNYKDGKKDGKWTEWDENGQIKSVVNYKDGELID